MKHYITLLTLMVMSCTEPTIVTIDYIETEHTIEVVAEFSDFEDFWSEPASGSYYLVTRNNQILESNTNRISGLKCLEPNDVDSTLISEPSFTYFNTNEDFTLYARLNSGDRISISKEIYNDYTEHNYDITREYILHRGLATYLELK